MSRPLEVSLQWSLIRERLSLVVVVLGVGKNWVLKLL